MERVPQDGVGTHGVAWPWPGWVIAGDVLTDNTGCVGWEAAAAEARVWRGSGSVLPPPVHTHRRARHDPATRESAPPELACHGFDTLHIRHVLQRACVAPLGPDFTHTQTSSFYPLEGEWPLRGCGVFSAEVQAVGLDAEASLRLPWVWVVGVVVKALQQRDLWKRKNFFVAPYLYMTWTALLVIIEK